MNGSCMWLSMLLVEIKDVLVVMKVDGNDGASMSVVPVADNFGGTGARRWCCCELGRWCCPRVVVAGAFLFVLRGGGALNVGAQARGHQDRSR